MGGKKKKNTPKKGPDSENVSHRGQEQRGAAARPLMSEQNFPELGQSRLNQREHDQNPGLPSPRTGGLGQNPVGSRGNTRASNLHEGQSQQSQPQQGVLHMDPQKQDLREQGHRQQSQRQQSQRQEYLPQQSQRQECQPQQVQSENPGSVDGHESLTKSTSKLSLQASPQSTQQIEVKWNNR